MDSVGILDDVLSCRCRIEGGRCDVCHPLVKHQASLTISEDQISAASMVLPSDSKARKNIPVARGVLDYFPAVFVELAKLAQAGNDKHNPGEELHWARGKSNDHADCIIRHLMDRGTVDPEDGILHDIKVAWRALAMAQLALEARGAPKARGAR